MLLEVHVAWSFHSQWWFGLPCHLLVLVDNAAIYQDILDHFMLPSVDKLYGEADFIFQQDLAPAHTVKGTKSWFNDHSVTVLDWPANSPDLNPIDYRESIQEEDERHQTQQCRWPEEPGLHCTWAVPQTDCLHAAPHWCSNSCKRRPFCHTCHTFQKPDISV